MKNKKGFTLIELLAVIVILAIIALIAIPIVLNMINNARKKAAESSAYGFVEAIEYNNGLADVSDDMGISYERVTGTNLDVTTINVKMKGKRPTSGTVTIDETGKVTTGDFCIEGYQVAYRGKEVTEVKKGCGNTSSSSESSTPGTTPISVTNTVYTLEDVVYFDPVSSAICDSTHTTSETCYKWRIITVDDDDTKENITIQLDHNIVNSSAWAPSSNTTGPTTALMALEGVTSGWTRVLGLTYSYDTSDATNNYGTLTCTNGACKIGIGNNFTTNLKARIITGEEIKDITINKMNELNIETSGTMVANWALTSSYNDYFYFSNSGYLIGNKTTGTGNVALAWLVENTKNHTGSGATSNTYGDANNGYWTLSPVSGTPNGAWLVTNSGSLTRGNVYLENVGGIRPVITINKSLIK